ncbi:hypothetical protein BST29_23570 [Mycobacterium malmoense]|uniref:PPE-PPW subfamily C-terminal domain-containing protein n=1 Tax=Mycobacterium malmoense TaxID=1780 RepID=A0ABX3SKC1_MYCMA|nr:hypothetical protein BST29_23570 [Mycobacterium malmoense]
MTSAGDASPARRRRRAKLTQLGRGYEYMDLEGDAGHGSGALPGRPRVASPLASDRSAGILGFAGTAREQAVGEAAGLTTLAGDSFGAGPTMPLIPNTWGRDLDGDE